MIYLLTEIQMPDKIIYIDIETVIEHDPAQYETYDKKHIREDRYCTGMDDLDIWVNANLISPKDRYIERWSLFPEFSKIICISVGSWENTDSVTAFRTKSFFGENERQILLEFNEYLQSQWEFKLCGHNLKYFDLPFIYRRMIVNGVKHHPALNNTDKKPREIPHIDTKDLRKWWGGANASLELICLCLGIGSPKEKISWNDMPKLIYSDQKEENMKNIVKYCEWDVRATAQVCQRILDIRPQLTEEILKEFSERVTSKTPEQLKKELYDTYRVPLGRDVQIHSTLSSKQKPEFTAELLEILCHKIRTWEKQYATAEDLFAVLTQHYIIPEVLEPTITRKYEEAHKIFVYAQKEKEALAAGKSEWDVLDDLLSGNSPLV